MIAKTNKSLLFEKWDGPAGLADFVQCDPDEVAIVSQYGAIKATLPAGQHAITTPDAEVTLVRMTPVAGLQGGTRVGDVPIDGVLVTPSTYFDYALRALEPVRLAQAVMGQRLDADALKGWVSMQIANSVKTVVVSRLSITIDPALIAEVTQGYAAGLAEMGIAAQIGSLTFTLSDEDRQLLAASKAPAPPAPTAAPQQTITIGARASVAWSDGKRYVGTVRAHQNGYIEIVWDNQSTVWVLPEHVLPA